jgi:hypothetical protein
MRTIEVDFDVYKALMMRRPTEDVTENDVLRELLQLPRSKEGPASPPVRNMAAGDWVAKGVRFPAGTEFRAHYKGQTHLGRVEAGALMLSGKRYDSPSAAAVSITGSPVNGWRFWEARLPGEAGWKMIESLRRRSG